VDLAASQARADQVASRARAVEIPQAHQEIGVNRVHQVLQTGAHGAQIHHPRVNLARADPALPPRERAARVDQDVNLVRAVRVAVVRVNQERVADPQVLLQMIKDGVSRVRVGALPRRPLVNQARAAVARANQERVAVLPQAHLVEIGVSIIDYLHTLHSIIFPLLTTTIINQTMFNLHRQARRLGRMGFIL